MDRATLTGNKTNEFSFVLKPAEHGVGVFTTHDIKKGTYLRLFGKDSGKETVTVERKYEDVPEFLRDHCVFREDHMLCPADFGRMEIGWYLNHSIAPNAYKKEPDWYALRDIKEGEEILVDYNSLDEPESAKDDYYQG